MVAAAFEDAAAAGRKVVSQPRQLQQPRLLLVSTLKSDFLCQIRSFDPQLMIRRIDVALEDDAVAAVFAAAAAVALWMKMYRDQMLRGPSSKMSSRFLKPL